MNKLLFISVLIFGVLTTNAQRTFGVQGGLNLATYIKGNEHSTKGNTGIIFGVVANKDLSNFLSFRPELNFIQKGGEQERNIFTAQNSEQVFEKIKLNYI